MFCSAVLYALVFILRQIARHGLGYCLLGANLLPTAATVFDEYILPLHHGFNKAARQREGALPA